MAERSVRLSDVLAATENPSQLAILRELEHGGPGTIAELAERVGQGRSTVYRHVRLLRDGRLVLPAGPARWRVGVLGWDRAEALRSRALAAGRREP
jgi:DNA-binding transcriptional ArsR family regulator